MLMTFHERWTKYSEYPMLVISLIFLAAYTFQVLVPTASEGKFFAAELTIWITWGTFVIDYLVRLATANQRWKWCLKNAHEIPILLLPVLRPLRLLRLLTLVTVFSRSAGSALRSQAASFAGLLTVILVYCGSLAILDTERGVEGSTVNNFGDALWWAVTTVTTVGYGDLYPVTGLGRIIAVVLMIGGVSVVGVLTASFASWLVESIKSDNEVRNDELMEEIRSLRSEITDSSIEKGHDNQINVEI